MKKDKEKSVKEALYKRATGFIAKEVISEYSKGDESVTLSKQRVTEKEVPPDISAVKLYLELARDSKELKEVSEMTDEEIQAEKYRLIKLLKEIEDGN